MNKVIITLIGIMIVIPASAALDSVFTATAPTQYEDGTVIPVTDILSYTVHCSTTSTGPYNVSWEVGIDPSNMQVSGVDMAGCVNGVPGTYYFVATDTSPDFGTTSIFSNETTKFFSAGDLGKIPLPPTIFSVQ